MTTTRPLIFTVHGTPATKGSLRHVGHGRLIEGNKNSTQWRTEVALAARSAMCTDHWSTIDSGAQVLITLWIARPKSVRNREPHTRSSGDVDKHARNILDALVDAHILTDDSRVVSLQVRKVYAPDDQTGARIAVFPRNGQIGLWIDLWTEWLMGCGQWARSLSRGSTGGSAVREYAHDGSAPTERSLTMNLLTGSAKAKLALSILNAHADTDPDGALRDVRIVLDGTESDAVFAKIQAARSAD